MGAAPSAEVPAEAVSREAQEGAPSAAAREAAVSNTEYSKPLFRQWFLSVFSFFHNKNYIIKLSKIKTVFLSKLCNFLPFGVKKGQKSIQLLIFVV